MPDRESSILLAYEVTAGESPPPSKEALEQRIVELQKQLDETISTYKIHYGQG